ncbi:MAG: ABC transporter permease [Clostridia bacterium]|nr:ABC transporter permease [Clostridia bacterium]
MAKQNKVHEPPFHIVKRPAIATWKAILIRTIAILLSLIVSSVVLIVLTKKSPFEAMQLVYEASFGKYKPELGTGFFTQMFTGRKFWAMLQELCMLLVIALAVTPAFKMKYWNLGAQGQVLFGGLCSVAVMFNLNQGYWATHKWLVLFLMLIAAILGGIIWAVIPALFKARWNTNESLFTLMMNYIAIQLISCMINVWNPSGSQVMGVVNQNTQIGWMPSMIFPESWGMSTSAKNYFFNILIVLALTVIMFVYLRYSKHGYELSVVGESVNTANYIGINVKKVIVRTLVFSGLLCGISGFLLVSGTDHSITTGLDRGYGFTAIIVAWLAKFNPLMMVVTSFLIVFLDKGASDIAMNMGFNESVGEIITGIIIFFIIGCEFFINYRIAKTHREG